MDAGAPPPVLQVAAVINIVFILHTFVLFKLKVNYLSAAQISFAAVALALAYLVSASISSFAVHQLFSPLYAILPWMVSFAVFHHASLQRCWQQESPSQLASLVLLSLSTQSLGLVVTGSFLRFWSHTLDSHEAMPWMNCFAFAAILSAADPLAVHGGSYRARHLTATNRSMLSLDACLREILSMIYFSVFAQLARSANSYPRPVTATPVLLSVFRMICKGSVVGACVGSLTAYALYITLQLSSVNATGAVFGVSIVLLALCDMNFLTTSLGGEGFLAVANGVAGFVLGNWGTDFAMHSSTRALLSSTTRILDTAFSGVLTFLLVFSGVLAVTFSGGASSQFSDAHLLAPISQLVFIGLAMVVCSMVSRFLAIKCSFCCIRMLQRRKWIVDEKETLQDTAAATGRPVSLEADPTGDTVWHTSHLIWSALPRGGCLAGLYFISSSGNAFPVKPRDLHAFHIICWTVLVASIVGITPMYDVLRLVHKARAHFTHYTRTDETLRPESLLAPHNSNSETASRSRWSRNITVIAPQKPSSATLGNVSRSSLRPLPSVEALLRSIGSLACSPMEGDVRSATCAPASTECGGRSSTGVPSVRSGQWLRAGGYGAITDSGVMCPRPSLRAFAFSSLVSSANFSSSVDDECEDEEVEAAHFNGVAQNKSWAAHLDS